MSHKDTQDTRKTGFSNPEEIYRVLFEQGPDGMFMTDPGNRLMAVNSRVIDLLGYSGKELMGMKIQDLVHPEDLARTPIAMEALAKGRMVTQERRLIRKDGSLVWVENRVRMLPEGNFLGITMDITERKRAEAVSRQQALELTALSALGVAISASLSFEHTADAAVKGIMDAAQPDVAFLFLREGERLMFRNILPPVEQRLVMEFPEHRVGECLCGLAAEEKKPVYALNIHCDARCTWDECKQAGFRSFAALPLRKGEDVFGVLGLASIKERDFESQAGFLETLANQVSVALTNTKLYEAAHKELAERKKSENRFRSLVESSPLGIHFYCLEADNRLVFTGANPAADTILGVDHSLFIGKTIEEAFPPLIHTDVPGKYREVVATGEIWETEQVQYDHEGIKGVFHIVAFRMEPGHMAVMFSDITGKKKAEDEKEELQARLQQAQKMEAIGALAGGIAHDFNNMMGVILGQVELGISGINPSEPIYRTLKDIEKAAQRSSELTRQLLAFARKQTVAPRVLDLNDTVSSMMNMLQRLIGEDIDLLWKPKKGIWPVRLDPSQIDQILANLCVNARDAIAGVGRLTLETDNRVFDEAYCAVHTGYLCGPYVMLAVSDDGQGMEKEIMGHIFEPFFTTKEAGKGTGLGLATVYGIVRQNEGFINVYSEPGKGTTFKIYLPRHGARMEEIPEEEIPKPFAKGNETILIAEDEPMILDIARTMLERHGYTILAAETPGEAIRLAREYTGKIHLLMTDVVMPEMNGRVLANTLLSIHPDLKCLFMSGYTANVIAHQGVLEKGVNFIQKPFSMNELIASVRKALDNSPI